MTFTTKDESEIFSAGFETANLDSESKTFHPSYGNVVRVNGGIYNHTAGGSYSQRLTAASASDIVGLAKGIKVMPGDTVKAVVFAKYLSMSSTPTNVGANIFTALATAFGVSAASPVDGAGIYTELSRLNGINDLLNISEEDTDVPKAYLHYILFDDNFLAYDMGFVRATEGAGSQHQELKLSALVTRPGYAYVYYSNESDRVVEVYFDEFKIEHIKSPVISSQDYFPFGLTFNSYSRENSLDNPHQYNSKELQDELSLGWLDYGARMYMSDIGRWGVIDALSEKSRRWSPYNYALDNPIRFIDPDGNAAASPGDKFKTEEAAALDLAKLYNDNSIKDKKEYGTKIYKVEDAKSKETYYTYNEPNIGGEDSVVPAPNGSQPGEVVARAHTHGADIPVHTVDEFSESDTDNAERLGVNSYVATPNGSLLKYDHISEKTTTISTDVPSDENHFGTRMNNIDSGPLPKNEPTRSFLKALVVDSFVRVMTRDRNNEPMVPIFMY